MLLLISIIVGAIMYPTQSVKIAPPVTSIQSQIPASTLQQHTLKTDKQSATIEGQFIIAEGNSDHLFEPCDFIKEDIIKCKEANIKNNENDRDSHDTTTISSLPRIQVVEGHFIHYENQSDEHLFDKEDFQKENCELNLATSN